MTDQPPAISKPRPGTVTFAVWLQLLLAVFLVVSAVVGFIYGSDAQEAFESELSNQGVEVADLPEGSTGFGGDVSSMGMPIVMALILVVLALLNGGGKRIGRILSWILQPIILVCGGFIFGSALFLTDLLQVSFDNSGDPDLEALNVEALVDAVTGAYPSWSPFVDWTLAILATVGSLLVIILLALPKSNEFFRKEPPQTHIPGAPTQ